MTKKGLFLLLFGFSLLKIFAEDAEPDDKTLQAFKNIIKLEIEVSLIQQDQKIAWNTKVSKYTIPGKAVNLTIEGNYIKMYGSFTPYYDMSGNLILLAQGQIFIFITSPSGNALRYFSYIKSIRVEMGEKLVFFPLGFSETSTPEDATNIEIDIQIQSYSTPVKEDSK